MQVVYHLEALADLAGHFRYIAREDPQAAAKVAAEIRRAIGRLALFHGPAGRVQYRARSSS